MINSSSNSSKAREIPIADLHKTFSAQIDALDPQRADSVAELATVRSAKNSTLAHEQNLLARKFGPNSARVTAVVAQQAKNAVLQTVLEAEAVRAQVSAPVASGSGYVFHGYVKDDKSQPLPNLSVALYDNEGKWLSELGYGCTDETGYFLMRFDQPQKPTPSPAPTPAPAPQPAPAPAPVTPMGKLFHPISSDTAPVNIIIKGRTDEAHTLNILVFDQQQKLLYRDPRPLQAQLDHVDYRVIIIGEGDAATCTPPPDSAASKSANQKSETYTPERDIASMRKERAQSVAEKPAARVKTVPVAAVKKTPAAVSRRATTARRPDKKSRSKKSSPLKKKSARPRKKSR